MPAAQLGFGVVSYRAMANRPALRTQRGVSGQRATFQNPLILRQVRGFLARATEKEFKAEEASGSDDEASVQKVGQKRQAYALL